MRENRTSGSEGRESELNRTSLPLSNHFSLIDYQACGVIPAINTTSLQATRGRDWALLGTL